MVFIVHAGQFDMFRAVLQYALFNLLEEPFPISLVLILRQDNDLLQVIDRDVIVFLEVSNHKPGRMMRVIRLDQTEGILNGDHLMDPFVRLFILPASALVIVVVVHISLRDPAGIRFGHDGIVHFFLHAAKRDQSIICQIPMVCVSSHPTTPLPIPQALDGGAAVWYSELNLK